LVIPQPHGLLPDPAFAGPRLESVTASTAAAVAVQIFITAAFSGAPQLGEGIRAAARTAASHHGHGHLHGIAGATPGTHQL
jgi:hypothetical protein